MTLVDFIDLDHDEWYVKVDVIDLSSDEDSVKKDAIVEDREEDDDNVPQSENLVEAGIILANFRTRCYCYNILINA